MSESAGQAPHPLLNALPSADLEAILRRCCGSRRWVQGMLARLPFTTLGELMLAADEVWAGLGADDYLEAFTHHPEIGADLEALRARFVHTAGWSSDEQSGVGAADDATLVGLRDANRAYKERFGYIFIICASGKSAGEMLGALEARLGNAAEAELPIAAGEQSKITKLRLAKL
jgi:2-oxo-4-hydroxy-4-carboxy-5-ureidoimidazoline decarboxylase